MIERAVMNAPVLPVVFDTFEDSVSKAVGPFDFFRLGLDDLFVFFAMVSIILKKGREV